MTNKKIIKNVLKMLMYRTLIEEKDIKQILSKINVKENKIVIKTNKNNYLLYITDDDLQSINKNQNILKLLKNNEKYNKIIVCENFEKKTMEQLYLYKNIEIFTKKYILLNILEHHLQPKFEFIDEKELEDLNIKKNQFPKMESIDPVSRYLNLNPGDIIKVIGYNENSIYDPHYRLVINSSISKLFKKEIY